MRGVGRGLRGALQQRPPNSATGYITPKDVLSGRQQEIHAERDRKLEAARQQRQSRAPASRVKSKRPDPMSKIVDLTPIVDPHGLDSAFTTLS